MKKTILIIAIGIFAVILIEFSSSILLNEDENLELQNSSRVIGSNKTKGTKEKPKVSSNNQLSAIEENRHTLSKSEEWIGSDAHANFLDNFDEAVSWNKNNFGHHAELLMSNADYIQYSYEALENLVAQGDFAAMHVLGWKYFQDLDFRNAQRVYKIAAVHGSTSALEILANIENSSNSSTSRLDEQITSLAYIQVALLRGDASQLLSASVKSKGIEMNDEIRLKIKSKANYIYNGLKTARKAMGLGSFQTDMPSAASVFHGTYKKRYSHLISGNNPLFMLNN